MRLHRLRSGNVPDLLELPVRVNVQLPRHRRADAANDASSGTTRAIVFRLRSLQPKAPVLHYRFISILFDNFSQF